MTSQVTTPSACGCNPTRGAWRAVFLGIVVTWIVTGCTTIPSRYLKQAEPGVTLSALVTNPQAYEGKVVILGGAVSEVIPKSQWFWVRMRNRPVDQDYQPHRPISPEGPEGGHYWVVVAKDVVPPSSEHWMRVTVVGRVVPPPKPGETPETHGEPVLAALYLKGWSAQGDSQGGWEQQIDANYLPTMPRDVRIE